MDKIELDIAEQDEKIAEQEREREHQFAEYCREKSDPYDEAWGSE